MLINCDLDFELKPAEKKQLRQLNVKIYFVPATKIASEVGGTELSTNIAMLGALLGVTTLVDKESFEKAMVDRFSSKKFVASGTTAVLDDAVKGRYAQTTQLIDNNMNVVKAATQSIRRYTFEEEAHYA